MKTIVLSWILGMITSEHQAIAKEHGVAVRQVWHTIEHQFIGNSETRVLHLNATFYNFVQGDLSVSDYCRKMKRTTNSLADLSCAVFDRNLIRNVLQGLNKQHDHL
jgi:hypothetical protein